MGHITSKGFKDLQKRLDKSPQGAPETETLFKILEILFTEDEAKVVSKLPMSFFTLEEGAKRINKSVEEAKKIFDSLADKAILFDSKKGDSKAYTLAAPMAGFFEFSLMRTDGKFDTKVLSELYHHYINVEDAFAMQVFGLDPAIDRVFVQEETVESSFILDYERATKVIETATDIAVGRCYCRHKMEHAGTACDMPQEDVCMTFNNPAKSLITHKIARSVSKEEAKKILKKCIDLGLVQIGDNVQNEVGWICNCCGCCCEAILAYKRLGYRSKIKSNFYACGTDTCTGCGLCAIKCPVDAIKVEGKKIIVDKEKCFGCGVCARACPVKSIEMKKKDKTEFVPKDVFERYLLMAVNEGKLQNYIFDNENLWTHRVLRNFIGFFLKLTPAKRLLVQNQMQSIFLKAAVRAYRKLNGYKSHPDYSHPEMKN